MKLYVCNDYEEMSRKACDLVGDYIRKNPGALVSFPGGTTPVGFIKVFVSAVNCGEVDISQARYISLDEWVGLSAEDEGSCARFNREHLLGRLEKNFADIHLINGASGEIDEERRKIDSYINLHGPLGVSVLGIGLNGHLGFNEEGVSADSRAVVVPLSPITKKVMSKYLGGRFYPEYGITQGLGQIMQAKMIVLLADGEHKAEILCRALKGRITPNIPASVLQNHPNLCVVTDKDAAKELCR